MVVFLVTLSSNLVKNGCLGIQDDGRGRKRDEEERVTRRKGRRGGKRLGGIVDPRGLVSGRDGKKHESNDASPTDSL